MSRTASRTLDLLEHVARAPAPAGLIELATDSGIDKSTAARLLAFLAERELVVRDPVTRRYAPGRALLALGAAALQRSDLRAGARPYLERLRAATGETVTLHVRVRDAFVCIDGLEGPSPVRRAVPLGESIPLYVGVTGKAILAFLAPAEIDRQFEAAAAAGVDVAALRSELAAVRAQRFRAAVGDRVPEVGAMAAPLFDGGAPYGAVSVSGPAARWDERRMRAAAPELTAVAAEMSTMLRPAPGMAA
jgi:DNA-binding IclR family transcriptional regulator